MFLSMLRQGSAIVHTPDQDTTDMTKCINYVLASELSSHVEDIFVFGSLSKTVDRHIRRQQRDVILRRQI